MSWFRKDGKLAEKEWFEKKEALLRELERHQAILSIARSLEKIAGSVLTKEEVQARTDAVLQATQAAQQLVPQDKFQEQMEEYEQNIKRSVGLL